MGVFKSKRQFWLDGPVDTALIANDVSQHFQAAGFEVVTKETGAGAWDVDVTRAGAFRAVLGMRTALKIRLECDEGKLVAQAGVGVLGQQVLPAVIAYFVFWPVIVTQVWGVIQAARLDNDAIKVVEHSVEKHTDHSSTVAVGVFQPGCGGCGQLNDTGAFCTNCGEPLTAR